MKLSDILAEHRRLTHPPVVPRSALWLHSVSALRRGPGYTRRLEVGNQLVVGRGNRTVVESQRQILLIDQSSDASST